MANQGGQQQQQQQQQSIAAAAVAAAAAASYPTDKLVFSPLLLLPSEQRQLLKGVQKVSEVPVASAPAGSSVPSKPASSTTDFVDSGSACYARPFRGAPVSPSCYRHPTHAAGGVINRESCL